MIVKCKRCKRILKSATARALGYGATCLKKVKSVNLKSLLSGEINAKLQKTKNYEGRDKKNKAPMRDDVFNSKSDGKRRNKRSICANGQGR